jgi:hypothetical protein
LKICHNARLKRAAAGFEIDPSRIFFPRLWPEAEVDTARQL